MVHGRREAGESLQHGAETHPGLILRTLGAAKKCRHGLAALLLLTSKAVSSCIQALHATVMSPIRKILLGRILSVAGVKAPLGGACLAEKSSQYGSQFPCMGMSVMCGAAGTEAATHRPSAGA